MSLTGTSRAPEDTAHLASDTTAEPAFIDLLQRAGISLIAALRPNKIVCLGAQDGALTISYTAMTMPLGIATNGASLAIGSRREITVFARSTRLAEHLPGRERQHDVLFVPVNTYRTGECMVHDMALDGPSVVFINTQFSCLGRADGFSSFVPLWQPPFISKLLPEDRCHLNSFAMDGKRIRYTTAFAASDTAMGYRALPIDSGVIIDVEANTVVTTGLIKPHSARVFHDKLYVLNSAAGEVTLTLSAAVDLVSGVVHHVMTQRHRSREFVAFLEQLDAHYPAGMLICLLLDNHSAHWARETKRFLASKPGRFELVFTPTHASWLNYVEIFFSKVARSVLRRIRVASKSRAGRPDRPLYRDLQRRAGTPELAIRYPSRLLGRGRPIESPIRERCTSRPQLSCDRRRC
jgi:uncharacterized protein (TIGR03032 family)